MNRFIAAFVALSVLSPHFGLAKPRPSNDWAVVRSVPAGMRIAVNLNNGKTVKGLMDSTTPVSIAIRRHGTVKSFPAVSVRQLRVRKSFNERPLGWILTAVTGAVTHVLISLGSGSGFEDGELEVILLMSGGITAGAAALGFSIKRMRLIYEAGPQLQAKEN